MRVRFTVTPGTVPRCTIASFKVGGSGKPVEIRRGPATVTGEAVRTTPLGATREGAAGRPGSQETSLRPQSTYALVERGGFMFRRSLGLLAVLAAVAVTSSTALAAGPANVTVRVEGDAATLVPRTALTTTTTPVSKDGDPSHSCSGTSAAGAVEEATGGDWSGTYYSGLGYSVDKIRGELHDFGGDPEYWGLFVDEVLSQTGLCFTELQSGERVLLAPIAESCPSTSGVLA